MLRRIARFSLLAILLVMLAAPAGDARGSRGGHGRHHHGHGRVFVGFGPWWWGPPYPYWSYPPPYPRVVIEEPLPVYIERSAEPDGYWYYCPSAQAYYPQAATCQEAWIKVAPRSE